MLLMLIFLSTFLGITTIVHHVIATIQCHVVFVLFVVGITLPLHCPTYWNFVGGRRLLVVYSFDKNFYTSSMVIFSPNCVFFVDFDLFFLY
jgi:hypothetical protein